MISTQYFTLLKIRLLIHTSAGVSPHVLSESIHVELLRWNETGGFDFIRFDDYFGLLDFDVLGAVLFGRRDVSLFIEGGVFSGDNCVCECTESVG